MKHKIHLCDICEFEVYKCKATNVKFGIDEDPNLRGAAADKILTCDTFNPDACKIMESNI